MRVNIGFWCYQVASLYITRTVTLFMTDDGYGNLIRCDPAFAIESSVGQLIGDYQD